MDNNSFLLLINGTSGVGKTTLIHKIHDMYPMSYLINIDVMRKQFSHFREHLQEAIDENIVITGLVAEYLLSKKYIVLIDRMLWGTHGNMNYFPDIAQKMKVPFVEIMLTAEKNVVINRANDRGYPLEKEGGLSADKVERYFELTLKDIKNRKPEFILDTTDLSPEEVFIKAQEIIKSVIL